ncbi:MULTISPECIES: hypothetical protein [Henriciella]|jgi:hypothetical protein|uniref:DUF4760 domain-containing protein n=1 Tax=Henriciella pelagia TaxID=1977912 RepID=A0ABQ1JWE5_9PROT|nr:hypothetical protein [Henriciella pelagia]GGB78772.1 hypothetical protein GCM10011503_29520 [Henriciella pelagia]
MSLNEVYLVSQIVAAAAVIPSLIALIISVRQNTRAQKTASVQSITSAIAAINIPGSESPALGDALQVATRDWEEASRDQRILAHYFLFSFFKLCEQAWYQHESGALDESQWAGWENSILRFYHSPGVKEGWWPHRRGAYSPAFQEFLALSTPPSSLGLFTMFGEREEASPLQAVS